ncbi:MAG: hypothetical protein GC162_13950 [Planctomycetes bacterium]|nr:hypothetical protein [Planctomycetota bacterium]
MPMTPETRDLVSELVWQLVDEAISATDRMTLEDYLANNAEARIIYAEIMTMHKQLMQFFGSDRTGAVAA